jgi:hypothetical protein
MTSSVLFLKGSSVHRAPLHRNQIFHVAFPDNSPDSFPFLIWNDSLANSDNLQVSVGFTGNFANISGCRFLWLFTDFSSLFYAKAARLLLSFFIAYNMIAFLFTAGNWRGYALSLGLGIAGVLASNPVSLFWEHAAFLDGFFVGFYIGLFRLVCLIELNSIRKVSQSFIVLFCAAFAFLDISKYEGLLVCFELGYGLLFLGLAAAALWESSDCLSRRLGFLCLFLGVDALCLWVSRLGFVICDWFGYSLLPLTLHAAPAMTAGSFLFVSMRDELPSEGDVASAEPRAGDEKSQEAAFGRL